MPYIRNKRTGETVWVDPPQSGVGPQNPSYPYEGSKAAADAQRAQTEASVASQTAPAVVRKTQADASVAEANAAATNQETAAAAQAKAMKRLSDLAKSDNVLSTVRDARTMVRKGNTAGWGSLLSNLPATDARDLKGYVDTLKGNLGFDRLQQMRDESPTGGALGQVSNIELGLLTSTIASLDQAQSTEKLLDSLDRIETHYKRFQTAISGVNPDTDEGRRVMESAFTPGGNNKPPSPDDFTLGIDERFATPADKRFAALAQSAFERGASFDEMQAIAKEYGYEGFKPDLLQENIRRRDQGEPVGDVQAPESGYNDPSIIDRALQNIGAGPAGAYFGGAGNALTFGMMDELQGIAKGDTIGEALAGTGQNTTEANLLKYLQSKANPNWNAIGNVSGGVIGALGTGAIAGGGRAATALAPKALLGDLLYGSAYGAGESNENRLSGALLGGGAGVAGGAVGRKAVDTIGSLLQGTGGPQAYLREQGITLTPGQIRGGKAKAKEDRLMGFGGIGDAILARRKEGVDQFNRAAFRQGLDPIKEVPPGIAEEGIDQATGMVSDAYSRALDDVVLQADDPFIQALGQQRSQAAGLPAIGDQAEYSLERAIAPFVDQEGKIAGRDVQKILQELGRRASRLEKGNDAVGPDAASILRETGETVGDLVNRQAPGVMPEYRNANTAYRNKKILEDAVGRGMNTGGKFTPAQLGEAAKSNAKKYGGKFASQDRPFFELQRAGQEVLPSKIPDSGTAGRSAVNDGIMAVARSVIRNTRTPLYSKPVLEALNAIAIDRPEIFQQIGEQIRKKSTIGGLLGAPAAVPAVLPAIE